MKLITYNIWNHDSNFNERLKLIAELLHNENADIIALQEVRNESVVQSIQAVCNLPYTYWKGYHDCEEGLVILSRHKILSTWTNWDTSTDVHNSGSMCVEVEYKNKRISISNVHLDYKHAHNREIEILKLTQHVKTLNSEYNILLGDFNTYPDSSIHGFLSGRQSLKDENARWIDLGQSYSTRQGIELDVTIDFYNNPRWENASILDLPGRFDWILLENPYPNVYPLLTEYKLIGKEIVNGMTASDHYGVVCCLQFTQ